MNILNRLRKPYIATILALIFLMPTLNSCSADNEIINKKNLLIKGLEYNQLRTIALQVNGLQTRTVLNRNSENSSEAEIKMILQPLVENGRQIHNEIIFQVDLSNSEFGLTQDDINEIKNLDEKELAQLSFTFSTLQAHTRGGDEQARTPWDTETIMNCLGAALGLHEIYGIVKNTTQLATAQGALRVVKLLARRYIGWLGIAVAVYSFGNCMEAW